MVTFLNTAIVELADTGHEKAQHRPRRDFALHNLYPGVEQWVTVFLKFLLNSEGLKVGGISYTREQARREGWTVVF